jgi:hypothetical protein
MVGRRLVLGLALGLLVTGGAGARPPVLPRLVLEDQEERKLDLDELRGRTVIVVYGGRAGVERHVRWGRRLDASLRARGVYRAEDPPLSRPVEILAVAQMGNPPKPLRGMVRALLRQKVETGYSLWLDWDGELSRLFGDHDPASTVVVADRDGSVQLVVAGLPDGQPWEQVTAVLARLH